MYISRALDYRNLGNYHFWISLYAIFCRKCISVSALELKTYLGCNSSQSRSSCHSLSSSWNSRLKCDEKTSWIIIFEIKSVSNKAKISYFWTHSWVSRDEKIEWNHISKCIYEPYKNNDLNYFIIFIYDNTWIISPEVICFFLFSLFQAQILLIFIILPTS